MKLLISFILGICIMRNRSSPCTGCRDFERNEEEGPVDCCCYFKHKYLRVDSDVLEKLIQKELEKAMGGCLAISAGKEDQPSDSVLDLSPEEKEMDESITQNIMEAMDTFRKN